MATSGILMFAKHRDAEVAVSKMFQARTVHKNYVALVQGKLEGEGSVEVPLITDWENRPRQRVHFELGKAAKTLYQALEYLPQQDISRVLLTPLPVVPISYAYICCISVILLLETKFIILNPSAVL